ncbi:peptide-methionine (R)-S-oxide reductase MsrB [Thermococcus sp. M36]|uniref:peptide-methionine (R)-S-oxide reductase MsrB n=1 Tax=Thermococcus sp. M36 TaxID=1638261 RepID=UPI00318394F1
MNVGHILHPDTTKKISFKIFFICFCFQLSVLDGSVQKVFEYWDSHEEGIYVDVVSGEPLFRSFDKFNSGTGWPSFTKPLEEWAMVEAEECEGFLCGREVRSRFAGSHLGHVFEEPTPTGRRYCINSVSLRFIPREGLRRYGYVAYEGLFK